MPTFIQSTFFAIQPSMELATLLGSGNADNTFRDIFLIFAVGIVSFPMIVVHEFGHLIAGRLMGLRIVELNIGFGKILWQGNFCGIHFILRWLPFSGHVHHLLSDSTTRFANFIFIAGGPLANLLAAGAISWWSGENLANFFTQPSFAAVMIAANLYLIISNLIPIANRTGISPDRGNDGWQLWRILRNKAASLEPNEIKRLRKNVNLVRLQQHARLARITQYILGGFLIIIALGLAIVIHPVVRAIIETGDDESVRIGAICIISVIVFVFLGFLGLGILMIRKAWTEFASNEAKKKFSPLREQISQYRLMIIHQMSQWNLNELPEEVRLKIVSSSGDEDTITFLEEIYEKWPAMPAINLLLHNSFISAGRYLEAQCKITSVLERDDLPDLIRFHFETCLLSAQLSAKPDDATIARCQKTIDSISDDGLKMWRLVDLASGIITAKHANQLDQATKWCEQAHDIYPYDAVVLLQSAIIHLEKNDMKSAKSNLKDAMAVSYEPYSIQIRAWIAIAAAIANDPKAAKLLDQSLAKPLPLRLRRKLEEMQLNLSRSKP